MHPVPWLVVALPAALLAHGAAAQSGDCPNAIMIYFERESSTITSDGVRVVEMAGERLGNCVPSAVVVTGHLDSAENAASGLGQARARAVAHMLRPLINNRPIVTEDAGYSNPARLTERGVYEPENSRVVINAI